MCDETKLLQETNPAIAQEPDQRNLADPVATTAATKAAAKAPRLKVVQVGKTRNIFPDCKNGSQGIQLLRTALGAGDDDFFEGIIFQLVKVCSGDDGVDEAQLNFMLSIVKEKQPRDQTEALLAVQMATVHVAAMDCASRLRKCETLQELDSYQNAFNKLSRTFISQVDASKRYRSDGEQTVVVQQNVSVSEGGQAIVGNVTQGLRPDSNIAPREVPRALNDASASAMPVIEETDQRTAAVITKSEDK
jgi:hypothetical protein